MSLSGIRACWRLYRSDSSVETYLAVAVLAVLSVPVLLSLKGRDTDV